VKEVAAAMQRNGMQAAGYNLISLDDCWVGPNRTSEGELTWDRARFPAGIPELARWLQHRDFQLGIYTSAGSTTCTGLPG
jgi:alpha-galactosidase